jgi:cytidylate kinase
MTTHPYLHQGLTILHAQLRPSPAFSLKPAAHDVHPFITLSHETCAGATTLGEHLLPLLNEHSHEEGRSWMFLDKDLINRALGLSNLPEQLAHYLPEDRISEIKGLIGEMVGLHPPLWELEHQVTEAIVKFARLGCVILSGRAAHLITREMQGGFHLRLVAPFESRVHRAQAMRQTTRAVAEQYIRETDGARERHLQTQFDEDINDPHLYDLVINTDRVSPATAARLVLTAVQERMNALLPVS